MDMKTKDKKALTLFLILTTVISAIWETVYIMNPNSLFILILMWTPGFAGIVTSQVYYKKENALGIRLGKLRYIFAGIFIPVIYLTVSYGIAWRVLNDPTAGMEALAKTLGYQTDLSIPVIGYLIIACVIGTCSSCLSSLGEELGWRGFMYPVMERVIGRKRALLFSGMIWALWHMPIMIAGLYQAETQLAYGLLMFTIQVTLLSVIMSWLRMASNSMIPALFVHASHNFFDQAIFQPMSTEKYVPYFAGEQGFVTILIIAVLAGGVIWIWKYEEMHH